MGRKKPPGAKRKGPTVTVEPITPGELPDAFRRAMESTVVFFVGAGHEWAAADFCHAFMDATTFEPVPKPDVYSFFATADAELDELGAVAILAHGLHENHVSALQDAIEDSPHYREWNAWVPDPFGYQWQPPDGLRA